MIEPIAIDDIPSIRDGRKLNPLRAFADETVIAFDKSGADAAIVTGAPEGCKINQITYQLRDALWRRGMSDRIRIMQRKRNVYIARIQP
ncbi:hypothetical protein [Raoultibacter timonensis]|uniref:Uncharacterized protein n=1 Tax=Raoultibacter timonensis TaxID=1907662 RepID=A0ABM7WFA6_9ACTN|nr:hypothetical protein [Raoultibacter timonensis]BDE94910.1 hypothetical protein CE91St30_02430 [Raoultibacter timonensis]BDF49513.1 hypothetical protein CE91St31_02430 [Raoultibacter timonensis]